MNRSTISSILRVFARTTCCAGIAAAPLGCASGKHSAGPEFPSIAIAATPLDVQVIRDETHISLTNTTATSFADATMWVNRWFSRDLPKLDAGESITLDLREFRDSSGDVFRAGGFFATKKPTPLVACHIQQGDQWYSLTVVAPREEPK
jgi:hypothetical protein